MSAGRLTVRGAFELLLELSTRTDSGNKDCCCICGTGVLENDDVITVTCIPHVSQLKFHVCGAWCAYELGKRTMPALELLGRSRPVRAVPTGRAAGRGAGRRTSTHAGTVTGRRRKNGTRAADRAKTRG